ncbi:MAG: flavin reductase family protein [Burkholderiaceae bacterium]
MPPVQPAEYVDAIAQHVASVCVITTELEGERFGLTATAVASVSADPPRLLVCINRAGITHDKIVEAGHFCVNVLTENQDKVAMVFAGMGGDRHDRFEVGDWTALTTGAPALRGAAASLDCVVGQVCGQATHSVLFGDVVATVRLPGQDTLLYGGRRFRQLRKIFAGMVDGPDEYL